MRALSWLRQILRSERGNVIVIGAAVMPLMIGAGAVALDTIQLSLWKRQLQRAADSSALAGAHSLAQQKPPAAAVGRDLQLNNQVPLTGAPTVQSAPASGLYAGDTKAVFVSLSSQQSLPFWSFFTGSPPSITVEATAKVVALGQFCMLSLYEGPLAGIDVAGNAAVNLGCGIASNSQGTNTITAVGNSSITATPIISVGGINGSNNFSGNPQLLPYSDKQKDPLAYLPDPPFPSNCTNLSVNNGETVTVEGTACFSSIDVMPGGTLLLKPGIYTVNGGDISLKGSIQSIAGTGTNTGVSFIMTGPGGAAGDLRINSQAELKLQAPTSGEYSGILFYRDRRASNIEISINGGASSTLEGALYFPASDIKFAGHSSMNVRCVQLIGQKLKFRGGANISNQCPPGSGSRPFEGAVVRLVG